MKLKGSGVTSTNKNHLKGRKTIKTTTQLDLHERVVKVETLYLQKLGIGEQSMDPKAPEG